MHILGLLCIFCVFSLWTGACISREIIIETINFLKSKMRDTTETNSQLFGLRFDALSVNIIHFVIIYKQTETIMQFAG
jgi:hypothetical protein